ncbi:hypothetical protein [Streptomyces sp. ST2-7A]|uniref:hypothetical protein n=1 Tax=Streptomyces sp. ST2-7A TaxID=2907214 RepID=UPI001F2ED43B|nr:hypothetical protein [Streptomyces sp. ST2-7A]MCE7080560.1 hypothetical protein [Streptomyces sp. ST2-7A]
MTGLRLYTRAPLTPGWLARTVLPACRALREDHGAGVVHIRRGWLHGPHVDIVAQPGRGSELPWRELASRLDAGPPGDRPMTEEEYLNRAREFGRLENVAPPYLPMRDHGALEFLSAEDEKGWPAPLNDLRALALGRLNQPLLRTVEAFAAPPVDATLHVAEAFVALADAHHAGAAFGVFSLRSHAEAFLAWTAGGKDPRPAFDRRLEDDAPGLLPVVENALAGRPDPRTAEWGRAFAYCTGLFDGAVARGDLTPAVVDGLGPGFDTDTMGPPGGRGAADHEPSAFHRAVDASGVIADPPQWFASYRLVVNLFYQQLPLLGLPPMHRYYFCHAIAELVDRVLGEPWSERLERVASRDTKEAV